MEHSTGRFGECAGLFYDGHKFCPLQVQVIGGKDRGKTGIVLEVCRKSNRLYVEGLNLVRANLSIAAVIRVCFRTESMLQGQQIGKEVEF